MYIWILSVACVLLFTLLLFQIVSIKLDLYHYQKKYINLITSVTKYVDNAVLNESKNNYLRVYTLKINVEGTMDISNCPEIKHYFSSCVFRNEFVVVQCPDGNSTKEVKFKNITCLLVDKAVGNSELMFSEYQNETISFLLFGNNITCKLLKYSIQYDDMLRKFEVLCKSNDTLLKMLHYTNTHYLVMCATFNPLNMEIEEPDALKGCDIPTLCVLSDKSTSKSIQDYLEKKPRKEYIDYVVGYQIKPNNI